MLFTTSATQPGGKRRGFTGRYGLGLVLREEGPAIAMLDVLEGATVWLLKSVYDIYLASFPI